MNWFRTHPYISALCAASILVFAGTFIVVSRTMQPAGTRTTTWEGEASPLLNPISYGQAQNSSSNDGPSVSSALDSPPYTYIAPSFSIPSSFEEGDSYDFEAFIEKLIKEASQKKQTGTSSENALVNAYAYIPTGLISTITPLTTRTPIQQELYTYGNDIGSTIESFEQQHSNTIQLLKNQVEDRSNPEKAAAVVDIGRALQGMGENLAAMENTPSAMTSAHKALAQSYIEIGTKLALVPGAERDSDFIAAIQVYNAAADTFVKNYIQIVSLFGAYGVTFSPADAGRVFTFSPTGF